ncbi:unnamed protein product [Mytilus edulis]|uniref:Uncharacterized protein n=1 Tax=Mytilus edulis TaxID=6550 RepID=A0A8S3SJ79_MYTED|nr:unnamed protein product [Mytilus edulis]
MREYVTAQIIENAQKPGQQKTNRDTMDCKKPQKDICDVCGRWSHFTCANVQSVPIDGIVCYICDTQYQYHIDYICNIIPIINGTMSDYGRVQRRYSPLGLDIGTHYRTIKKEFASCIAKAEVAKITKDMKDVTFISPISDGSTDPSHEEVEIMSDIVTKGTLILFVH